MKRSARKSSEKSGLPPGTLIHIGEAPPEPVRIRSIHYDESLVAEEECADPKEAFGAGEGITWINVDGVHEPALIDRIGEMASLHSLTREDIVTTTQRPKVDDFGEYVYIVVRMIRMADGEIRSEQVSIVLMPHTVISFQEREGDVFDPIRERIRTGKGRLRKGGSGYLAYALLDAVVDGYYGVFEGIGDEVEVLEEAVVSEPDPAVLQRIYRLKRELIAIRKTIWPLREVVATLERSDSDLLGDDLRIYLRDVYDHTIQMVDTLETYRDTLAGMVDIYLSSVSNRMNEVMKVLTIIATIFIPLTFIAGLYGMNFAVMPELAHPMGYPLVLIAMALIAVGEVIYFHKRGWL
ncbi:MAG: magnesium/cobalt transporter CorA [Methanomicrobiales archaeon]